MTKTRHDTRRPSLWTSTFSLLLLTGLVLTLPADLLAADPHAFTQQDVTEEAAPAQPDVNLIPLWAAFEGQADGPVTVFWHPLWGTPKTIYGTLSQALAPSEPAARQFLAQHASLFKLDPTLADLQLSTELNSLIGRQFVFAQIYQGIPVYGGEVKIQFNSQGRVIAVNNSYVPLAGFIVSPPSTSAAAALEAAREHVEKGRGAKPFDEGVSAPITKLVIYADDGTPTLAWEVSQHTWGPTWQSFIQAHSGRPVKSPKDINRYANGQVFQVNAVVATGNTGLRDNKDADSAVPNNAYVTYLLQGLLTTGYLDGDYASSQASKRRVFSTGDFLYDRSSSGFNETMGYYYLDYAQRRIQALGFVDDASSTTGGTRSINKRQQVFSVDRYSHDNSYYAPSTKNLTFGTGGVDDAEDAEVIWHEYGHSIQDNQVPGFGSTAESGAMGEGFGDYWAGSLSAQIKTMSWADGKDQAVCIAEWDATSYRSTNPPCLRRLDGTKRYPTDLVGGVHADGEIWSAALWQIRTALGADKADRIILQHHFLLQKDSSFNTAANALITAMDGYITLRGYGYTRTEKDAMTCILRTRGFTVGGSSTPCSW